MQEKKIATKEKHHESLMRISVFKLMLLVRVVSLSSIESAKSFMAFVKIFLETRNAETLVLPTACVFWAMALRTGAWARRIAVGFGAVPSMLPLCGTKSIRLPRMYVDL